MNKISFLITISRHIQFGTEAIVTDANTSALFQSVVSMSRIYKKRGFPIYTLHMDGHLDTTRIRGAVAKLYVTLNPVSDNEHVTESYRCMRNIKEMGRYVNLMFLIE